MLPGTLVPGTILCINDSWRILAMLAGHTKRTHPPPLHISCVNTIGDLCVCMLCLCVHVVWMDVATGRLLTELFMLWCVVFTCCVFYSQLSTENFPSQSQQKHTAWILEPGPLMHGSGSSCSQDAGFLSFS